MGMIYVKVTTGKLIPDEGQRTGRNNISKTFKESLINVLASIIPKANPDFEGKIQDVQQWIIEVDDEEGTPQREIGLDSQGNVMMIMPWKDNHGFFTDSNVRVEELAKSYEIDFVDKDYFEHLWATFGAKNAMR